MMEKNTERVLLDRVLFISSFLDFSLLFDQSIDSYKTIKDIKACYNSRDDRQTDIFSYSHSILIDFSKVSTDRT